MFLFALCETASSSHIYENWNIYLYAVVQVRFGVFTATVVFPIPISSWLEDGCFQFIHYKYWTSCKEYISACKRGYCYFLISKHIMYHTCFLTCKSLIFNIFRKTLGFGELLTSVVQWFISSLSYFFSAVSGQKHKRNCSCTQPNFFFFFFFRAQFKEDQGNKK